MVIILINNHLKMCHPEKRTEYTLARLLQRQWIPEQYINYGFIEDMFVLFIFKMQGGLCVCVCVCQSGIIWLPVFIKKRDISPYKIIYQNSI